MADTEYEQKLQQSILTDAGRQLFLKVASGTGTLVFTKAILSSQKKEDSRHQSLSDEMIRQFVKLPDDLRDGTLKISSFEKGSFKVIADFDNKKLQSDIQFSSIGWYAKVVDSDPKIITPETLLAITFTTKDHETLAAGSPDGLSTDVISAELSLVISNAAKVDMTINQAGYITRAEFNRTLEENAESINESFTDIAQGWIKVALKDKDGNPIYDHNGKQIIGKQSIINTDKTLSITDRAADAGKVGEALTSLNKQLSNLDGELHTKYSTKLDLQNVKNTVLYNSDINQRQDNQINGLITKTADLENGVINNTRSIRILGHDGRQLSTHTQSSVAARTQYVKIDSSLTDYNAVANAGKVGEALNQLFWLLNASINALTVKLSSLDSNQTIITLANRVAALEDKTKNIK